MKHFLIEQRDWLEIEWLPGYAPDLNPTEAVWNNIKGRELANFCADQIDEAANAFRTGLRLSLTLCSCPFLSSSTPAFLFDHIVTLLCEIQ